jgi:hypothetical protein
MNGGHHLAATDQCGPGFGDLNADELGHGCFDERFCANYR